MKISKALKKEKKQEKHFFIFMTLLFFILPLIIFLSQIKSVFLWIYLGVIEILISITCISKINYHKLEFNYSNNKLKIKSGLFLKSFIIICDKVVIVHTDKDKEEMDILIISTTKVRNKYLKPVSESFLRKYPEASQEYIKVKKVNPEESYYYQIIRKGALKKYILLDTIYKNCVKATYTASAIENIKIARDKIDII
ncbi:MAG: hypothetical protein IJO26_01420 [Clostridium sp.]|nr:hypothetical protein [Clostridium sp.]